MRIFLTALTMLTGLPAGKNFMPTEEEIRRTPFCFPLIGIVIGLVLGAIGMGIGRIFPPLLGAAFLTLLSELPTRAFHLDGLADTADGFLSSRPRERILEIMHDSHIGTMGVLSIAGWSLIKFAAFAVLPMQLVPAALVLMSLNGRCVMVYHLMFCRYARENGLGKPVFENPPGAAMFFSILCSAVLTYAVFPQLNYLILPGIMLIFGGIWSLYCRAKIGGGTGDTLGASEELSEILTLLVLTVLNR